jgi:hypothetical protein
VTLVCADPARVHDIWPHVRDLIRAAMRRGDLGAFGPVEASVLAGAALLWLAIAREDGRERPDGYGERIQAAAVTELHETEWRKVCVIVACSGAAMRDWLPLLDGIEAYARAARCAAVRIMGRKGWARVLPSYNAKRIILEKDL